MVKMLRHKTFKYQIRGICFRSQTSIHITCIFRYKDQFWSSNDGSINLNYQRGHTIVMCFLQWSFIYMDTFIPARFPFPIGSVRFLLCSTLIGSLALISITCTLIL